MRQAGVIAAAGIVAVTEMVERLADDHANAKALAEGLAQIDGITIDPTAVETNIVFFNLETTASTPVELAQRLRSQGVLLNASAGRRMRAVMNHHVEAADVPVILQAFERALHADVAAGGDKVVVYG